MSYLWDICAWGLGFVFQGFPAPPLFKRGAISGNMQEIHKEKENFNIKRIAKFPCLGLSTFPFPPFLIIQNSCPEPSPDCDPCRHQSHMGTLQSVQQWKSNAWICAWLKAAFHSCEPKNGLSKGVVTLPNSREEGWWDNRGGCFQHDQRAVWSLQEQKSLARWACLEGSDKCNTGNHPAGKHFFIIGNPLSRRQLTRESGLSGPVSWPSPEVSSSYISKFEGFICLAWFMPRKSDSFRTDFRIPISRINMIFSVLPPSSIMLEGRSHPRYCQLQQKNFLNPYHERGLWLLEMYGSSGANSRLNLRRFCMEHGFIPKLWSKRHKPSTSS